jgi:hypothetical protein
VWGPNGSYTSALDPRCHEFFYDLWWGAKDVTDYGLTAGGTYTYRMFPVITTTCSISPTCPSGIEPLAYPPADVTVSLPNPLTPGKRPQVSLIPPTLFLQATVQPGTHSGGWYSNEIWRSVFYAWAPTPSAVSYVLSFDSLEWEVWGAEWVEVKTATVQASANPTYTVLVPAKTVRACIAIVTDPAALPDPRKGECIQTDVP